VSALLAQYINLPGVVGTFLAGLEVNAAVKDKPAFDGGFHLMGVLQRISLCYTAAASLQYRLSERALLGVAKVLRGIRRPRSSPAADSETYEHMLFRQ
jgi:hypothetical protein